MVNATEDFYEGFMQANIAIGKSRLEAEAIWEEYLNTAVTKDMILVAASDLISKFLYYDRKGDENLPLGAIEKAISSGLVTVVEITDIFHIEMMKNTE